VTLYLVLQNRKYEVMSYVFQGDVSTAMNIIVVSFLFPSIIMFHAL